MKLFSILNRNDLQIQNLNVLGGGGACFQFVKLFSSTACCSKNDRKSLTKKSQQLVGFITCQKYNYLLFSTSIYFLLFSSFDFLSISLYLLSCLDLVQFSKFVFSHSFIFFIFLGTFCWVVQYLDFFAVLLNVFTYVILYLDSFSDHLLWSVFLYELFNDIPRSVLVQFIDMSIHTAHVKIQKS